MVSVFPADTWQDRENGLRADLVQLLKDMKPGFLRFPGGCIVEGRFLDGRYQWKKTIGDPSDRKLIVNRWNDEFSGRATPDYYQSFGLGFYEYFQLSEDIGAAPLPILNCGMACQFNSGELAPLDKIDPYIQDALDLIEFANGPTTTPVGREAGGDGPSGAVQHEDARRRQRAVGPAVPRALRDVREGARALSIPRSGSSPARIPFTERENFKTQWDGLREIGADFVDEHFYRPPEWFYENVGRYDSLPAHRAEDLRRRVRGAPAAAPGDAAEHADGGAGGSGVPHRARAKRRPRGHVLVRAALRARRRVAVDAEPHLVRQPHVVRHAELLRAADVRSEPWDDAFCP